MTKKVAEAIEACGFVVALDDVDRAAERLIDELRSRGVSLDGDEWMARAKAMAARVESLRATLQILSEHDPPWSDDFLRARAALAKSLAEDILAKVLDILEQVSARFDATHTSYAR